MCIKIICSEEQKEFDPASPIEFQLADAEQVLVSYDPNDLFKIDSFVNGIERMVQTGIALNADIKVSTSNTLDGMRLERKLENLKNKIEVNKVIKGICNFHFDIENKLNEIKNMCSGRINE